MTQQKDLEEYSINNLKTVCVSKFNPEEYNIFYVDKQIGNIRLNGRHLTVKHIPTNKLVYEAVTKGKETLDKKERIYHLAKAVFAIKCKHFMYVNQRTV